MSIKNHLLDERKQVIKDGESAKSVGNKDGVEMYLPEDYLKVQKLNQLIEGLEKAKGIYLKPLEEGAGKALTYKSSGTTSVVVGEGYFINRYKLTENDKKETEVHFVADTIACDFQSTGTLHTKLVDVYVLVKDEKSKNKVKVDRIEKVSDVEFINDFRDSVGQDTFIRYMGAVVDFMQGEEYVKYTEVAPL